MTKRHGLAALRIEPLFEFAPIGTGIWAASQDGTPLSIDVTAPYRAQINYLKDAIADSEVLNGLILQRRLSVGTVDSFQGQQHDIIAITLTCSTPKARSASSLISAA